MVFIQSLIRQSLSDTLVIDSIIQFALEWLMVVSAFLS